MKILITGASGLIGTALQQYLNGQGHIVKPLRRGAGASGEEYPSWDIKNNYIDFKGFEPEIVIHLAGENIAQRWTQERKASILDSRVKGTRLLVSYLVEMENPPKVFLSGSATGFYGLRGDEILDEESSSKSDDFVSEVCIAWEAETQPAIEAGIRVVLMRTGIVLAKNGGAMAKMLPAFKTGVGGVVGTGKQYMSWISLDDMMGSIDFLMNNDVQGPVNLSAPNPSTNKEFTKALGKALRRPTFFPVPALAARTLFGEMANELLLGGARVLPKKLLAAGYKFKHNSIGDAFKAVLKK